MDARILDMLRQITPEEQAIPDGRRTIGRNADNIVLDALRRNEIGVATEKRPVQLTRLLRALF